MVNHDSMAAQKLAEGASSSNAWESWFTWFTWFTRDHTGKERTCE